MCHGSRKFGGWLSIRGSGAHQIQSNNLNVLEAAILKKLFNEYKVKNNDLAELKKRIDIVPISLAIAQAAIESGWGTSRFAKEGNAYFGQKIIGIKVNGIRPNDSENPLIKVRIFENLNDSVKAYLNNLNTHFAYKNFRKSRNELRSFGKQDPPNPGPAFKKRGPILGSSPMAFATSSTFAPGIFSHKFEIEFMKLILVARNALLLYFINSAVEKFV